MSKTRIVPANLIKIEMTAADMPGVVTKINHLGIPLYAIKLIDRLHAVALVRENELAALIREIERTGGCCKVIGKSYRQKLLSLLKKQAVLFLCAVVLLLLTVFLSNRILFVRVIGNSSVPTSLILSRAEKLGISFGCLREEIRNEKIKNSLLASIPQLQWAGVNTMGCVAEISVKEKNENIVDNNYNNTVSNIVANRDGVIISKTILSGTGVCEVGQAVFAGQLLVSGYTDCGIILKATNADAEILAQTKHELNVITPSIFKTRTVVLSNQKRHSVLIGKKLIKLYKDSGIWGGSCAKIYKRDYMQLPGGFVLPVCFITEHICCYQTMITRRENFDWLDEFSDSYLKSRMIAGQILDVEKDYSASAELVCCECRYECIEMIGQRILEEKIDTYGISN